MKWIVWQQQHIGQEKGNQNILSYGEMAQCDLKIGYDELNYVL